MVKPCQKAKAKANVKKGTGLTKAPLTKGKPKAGAKTKPLPKGKAQRAKALSKAKKAKLSKERLKHLGSMTPKEKVAAACENAETTEEAAAELRKNMTEQEKQSAWGKHQTHLKNNPKEAKEVNKMNKTEKGLAAAIYLLKKEQPRFLQVQKNVSAASTLTKGEVWESEKQMLDKFDKTEFETHIASGRIKWRADPWSYVVYNYYDRGNVKKKWEVARGHEASLVQELEADDELMETFQESEGKEQQGQLADFEASLLGKGGSKGKALTKGKGKGKGQKQLAIEDGKVDEETEDQEDDWDECLAKMRKCRDLCQQTNSNLEESLTKAKASGRLGNKQKKEVENLPKEGSSNVAKLKTLLVKRSKTMTVSEAKEMMLECTAKAKELKDEKKELDHIANKAATKASSKAK